MSSPNRSASISTLSNRASTSLAVRRGEVKISEPMPYSSTHAKFSEGFDVPARLEATWPRKSTPAIVHGRNTSSSRSEAEFDARLSTGPSVVPSRMSSAPSKRSLPREKDSGFRASLKRMFGSKRQKQSTAGSLHPWQQNVSCSLFVMYMNSKSTP